MAKFIRRHIIAPFRKRKTGTRLVLIAAAIVIGALCIRFLITTDFAAMFRRIGDIIPASASLLTLVVVASIAFGIKRIRGVIITGVLLTIPVFTTIFVIIKAFNWVDNALPKTLGRQWPMGLGIVAILIAAYCIGLAAKNYFGNKIIETGNAIISSIPFFNKIYIGIQQILDTIVMHNKKLFERVVLIEYPKSGSYSIAFVTSETTGEIPQKIGEEMLSLFVPTTPNPTSGYLLFLPEKDTIALEITVETAIKLVMSAGMVNSDDLVESREKYKVPDELKGFNWFKNLVKYSKNRLPNTDPRD